MAAISDSALQAKGESDHALSQCLLIAKPNSIEVFAMNNEALELLLDIQIFANILLLDKISAAEGDYVLVLSENCTLSGSKISLNQNELKFILNLQSKREKIDLSLIQLFTSQREH